MAPWDEISYFDTPRVSYVLPFVLQTGLVLGANSRRVGIIFTNSAANTIFVSPDQALPADGTSGIPVDQASQRVTIMQKEFGVLASTEWYGYKAAAGTNVLTIVEILLKDWPRPRLARTSQ